MGNTSREDMDSKFRLVFGTQDGKAVLRNICKFCHLMRSTYNNSSPDTSLFFKEGERNVGLYLLNRINETQYDMIKEIQQNGRE